MKDIARNACWSSGFEPLSILSEDNDTTDSPDGIRPRQEWGGGGGGGIMRADAEEET